jgi:opacity protein-like surface antigen
MKVSAAILSLATIVTAATSASAADMYGNAPGGIKDYRNGAVAVPVPVPYEDTYKWYIRGDMGAALKSSGSFGTPGLALDIDQPSEWSPRAFFSFGAGRYHTPNLRSEITVDMRGNRTLTEGTQNLTAQMTGTDTTTGDSGTNNYNISRTDRFTHQNSTFLLSGFYDINRTGKLRPYVGAGIGIAMHQIERTSSEITTCDVSTSTTTPFGGPPTTGCSTNGGMPLAYTLTSTSNSSIGLGLAAQLSAGLTYDIAPRTHWDTGYRMLWQSGNVAISNGTLAGTSTIRVGNTIGHELRTGLRLDLW